MSKEKAELVDRLNAIQSRIMSQWLLVDPILLDMKKKIEAQLDLLNNQEKDGRD